MRHLISAALLALTLTACGGGATEQEKEQARYFCTHEMGLDEYENSEGYDRCVEDAAKVADCLIDAGMGINEDEFVPSRCDGDEAIP